MKSLDEISYQLGKMNANLDAIKDNTSSLSKEVKSISDRVGTMENEATFRKGQESQNRKIAGVIGFVSGLLGSVGIKVTF